MLTLADVHAGYGSVRVLHSVALEVAAGECTAVLGRNGVGKSTLLRCIAGLVPLQGGSIGIDGGDVSSLTAFRRARLGISHVPQGRGIFGGLTVRENLRVGPAAQRPAAAAAAAERLLDEFPTLGAMANNKGASLSGGQHTPHAMEPAQVRQQPHEDLDLIVPPAFALGGVADGKDQRIALRGVDPEQ